MESLEYAKMLGDAGEAELPLLEVLCEAAELELAGRLKNGLAVEDCGGAFPVAAAWMALAGLYGGRGGGEPSSWTAGAVSVSGGSSDGEQADTLRGQAERLMAPYLRDDGFYFRGVRG